MRINQLATIMKYTPNQYMGYIFKSINANDCIVEETKKIAADIWKQKFVYINLEQMDMYDVYLMKVQYKNEPVVFFFDGMEKLDEKLRLDIYRNFSFERDENVHKESHIVYHLNEVNTNEYNNNILIPEYIIDHGMYLKIEP